MSKLDIWGNGWVFDGSTVNNYDDGRGSIAVTLNAQVINTSDNSLQRFEHDLVIYEELSVLSGATPLVEDTDYEAGDAAPDYITQIIRDAKGDQTLQVVNGIKIINAIYFNTDLDVTGEYAGDQLAARDWNSNPPIGSIMPWHKTFTNTPALPSEWMECNGQTVSDIESPYNGQSLPDLNGDERFLRGGATSGVLQADAFQGHNHEMFRKVNTGGSESSVDFSSNSDGSFAMTQLLEARDAITDGVNGTPRTADETRPINMSVVFIMKIK